VRQVRLMTALSAKKLTFLAILAMAAAGTALAQETSVSEGIPMNDQLTTTKCGGCHQRDANGMMRRLSYMRTSPEVWEQSIKRMVRLNGVTLKPEEGRAILKYLSNNNGLAPEEAKPVFWEAEHRLSRDQSDKIPSDALQHTCNYCHTIGRVLNQRRTKDDYEKLIAMHIGLFPGSENTFHPRRPSGPIDQAPYTIAGTGMPFVVPPADASTRAEKPDAKYPAEIAIDYLAKAQPLITPEWSAWKAIMRTPKLEGKYLLTGYQAGKGRVYGTFTIEQGAAPDEFATKTDLVYAASGIALSRSGKGIVYTGYSWRGRTAGGEKETPSADPGSHPTEWREAMIVSRDGNTIDGRFFWGGYQEFGIDAHLTRIGTQTLVAGASVFALKSPSTSEVKVYGANFPADLKAADFDLGSGVKVTGIVHREPSVATVTVQVDSGLPTGIRDLSVRRSTAERAIAVYDKVAYVKVTPDASMARLGGTITAKQFAQFEAVAYAAGPDGKTQTADDIPLGPISARWSMEEFVSTPGDDDVKYVGKLNDSGLFTPSLEGPNPDRKKQANNYPTNNWGDVWVAATFTSPEGTEMKARSYLVVTIPTYVRYDQPEVGQ
jgi:quinohemoprotein amine dehydrogenase